jgi:uncharacterized membrane protein
VSATLSLPAAIHLAAVVPAVGIGVWQLAARKGTRPHKLLGWIWVLAMAVAAISSFWVSKAGGFSVIHLLSVFVLFNLVSSIWYIRQGNVRAHKKFMVGTLIGLAGAGIGALMPGRFLAITFLS